MTSQQQRIPSPVVSGLVPENRPSRPFPEPERFSEYLCSDYCFSCTYFRSTKGHFGTCADTGPKIPYDGTKKGSACVGWRIKTSWAEATFKLPDGVTFTYPKLRVVHHRRTEPKKLKKVKETPIPFGTFWRHVPKPLKRIKIPKEPNPIKIRQPREPQFLPSSFVRHILKQERLKTRVIMKRRFRESQQEPRLQLYGVGVFWNHLEGTTVKRGRPSRTSQLPKSVAQFFIHIAKQRNVMGGACESCGSFDVVKGGMRPTLNGRVQRYRCRSCGNRGSKEHLPVYPESVKKRAIELVRGGLSLRKTAALLHADNKKSPSYMAIRNWVNESG